MTHDEFTTQARALHDALVEGETKLRLQYWGGYGLSLYIIDEQRRLKAQARALNEYQWGRENLVYRCGQLSRDLARTYIESSDDPNTAIANVMIEAMGEQ